jgi:cell shape-determining protein MreC
MSLRAKLKTKESVEEENEKLKGEIAELRARAVEEEKKKTKHKALIRDLQAQIASSKEVKMVGGHHAKGSGAEVRKKSALRTKVKK